MKHLSGSLSSFNDDLLIKSADNLIMSASDEDRTKYQIFRHSLEGMFDKFANALERLKDSTST